MSREVIQNLARTLMNFKLRENVNLVEKDNEILYHEPDYAEVVH